IGEHAQAIDLDEHGRVTEPGDAQTAAGRSAPARERIHCGERCRWDAPVALAQEVAHRRWWGVGITQPREDRVPIAQALACPQRRCLEALETRALGSPSQRFQLLDSKASPYATGRTRPGTPSPHSSVARSQCPVSAAAT